MMKRSTLALALSAAFVSTPGLAQTSLEEKLQILQQEIDELKAQNRQGKAEKPQAQTAVTKSAAGTPSEPAAGLAPGATGLFGYGEMSYNRFRDADRTSKADLRRFVFGFSHRFNHNLSFMSEVEYEHAVVSAGDQGEAEIEQAYLNYRFNDKLNVKGGLFLIPLGILNETHEPPTYFGVDRNEVETRIIPTTWRELGFGVHGLVGEGLKYDAGVTTGFDTGKLDDPSVGIRSAHQEGQLANARDLSVYGALNYRRPGLLLGGGVFTGNTGQNGQTNPLLKGVAARLTLWDLHVKYSVGRLDLQALYAAGTIGDTDRLNAAILASSPAPFAAPKTLKGAYFQAAYHAYREGDYDVAPFIRLERFDIRQQEDAANGLLQDPNNFERVRTLGLNFKIHPQVVLKTDIQRYRTDRTKDRFNVGLGYMF
jgi:TolA-binding protein